MERLQSLSVHSSERLVLAWQTYTDAFYLGKGASSEFEEISREVSTLHTAIKELQDEVENEDSILNRAGGSKKKEVEELVRHCRMVLLQLQRLVTRYKSLGTNQKRTWDRIKFGTEGVQDIREKLTFHTSAIQLFLTTLGTGSLGRIEKKLEMIIEEIRSGRREPSILTTSGDDDAEAEVQWDVLKSELVEDGFTKQDIESHKHWRLICNSSLTMESYRSVFLRPNSRTATRPHPQMETELQRSNLIISFRRWTRITPKAISETILSAPTPKHQQYPALLLLHMAKGLRLRSGPGP